MMNVKGRTKLTEECGELITILAKIDAFGSMGEHWDGKGSLKTRLEEEIADVMAACTFAMMINDLWVHNIRQRMRRKIRQLHYWNDGGKDLTAPNDYRPEECYDVDFVFGRRSWRERE